MSISYQQQDVGDFKKKAQSIASNIQKMSQNANSIDRLLNSARLDNQAMVQIHTITAYTNTLSKDTSEDLKVLATLANDKLEKLEKDKLISNYTAALNSFQAVQKQSVSREKQQLKEIRQEIASDSHIPPPPQSYRMKQMQQQHQDEDHEQQLMEMRQREESIRKLESDIVDVNQIFRDLATFVHEQGETVDSIEAHIESSTIRVSEGVQQLQKASNYATKTRKKQLCLFGTGAVILIVLILIIYYTS